MKKTMFCKIIILSFLITSGCDKESELPALHGPYLGQDPPGMQREIFAPGLISTGYEEHGVSFTPDGKELFWRMMGPPHGMTLTMKELNGGWTAPEVAGFSGNYDGKCSLSPDGNKILISWSAPPSGNGPALDHWTIWVISRSGNGWGKPEKIPDLRGACPTIANNGNIYFFKRAENNKGDIYYSRYTDGGYSKAERLPAPVNTEHWENDPYIAPDESYIIFQSFRPGSNGYGDLYVSYRKNDGIWTEPQNLGEGVNSKESGEGCPWVTPDGKYLFFSSMERTLPRYSNPPLTLARKLEILGQPGHGSEDVFWVSAKIIEGLRPDELK